MSISDIIRIIYIQFFSLLFLFLRSMIVSYEKRGKVGAWLLNKSLVFYDLSPFVTLLMRLVRRWASISQRMQTKQMVTLLLYRLGG